LLLRNLIFKKLSFFQNPVGFGKASTTTLYKYIIFWTRSHQVIPAIRSIAAKKGEARVKKPRDGILCLKSTPGNQKKRRNRKQRLPLSKSKTKPGGKSNKNRQKHLPVQV
jgi:hypothetical protein